MSGLRSPTKMWWCSERKTIYFKVCDIQCHGLTDHHSLSLSSMKKCFRKQEESADKWHEPDRITQEWHSQQEHQTKSHNREDWNKECSTVLSPPPLVSKTGRASNVPVCTEMEKTGRWQAWLWISLSLSPFLSLYHCLAYQHHETCAYVPKPAEVKSHTAPQTNLLFLWSCDLT